MKRQLVTALLVGTIVSAVFVTGNEYSVFAADISDTAATADTAEAAVTEDNTATDASAQDTATVAATQEDMTVESTEKSSSDYYMTVDPTPDNEALRKKYAAAREYTAQWQKYNYENGAYRSWVYMLSDGTYPRNKNYTVDGVTIYFNANGEATGWFIAYGNIYYAGSDGKYVTGEQTIDGKTYIFSQSGVLEEGTVTIGGKEYTKGKKEEEQPEEKKKSGWEEKDGKKFYYEDGKAIESRWAKIDDVWYYFEKNGSMATNRWIGNYYVGETGAMVTDSWIGKYYVGNDGRWIPDRWVKDSYGWWYRYGDGNYPKNEWKKIGNTLYYFHHSGYMAAGWTKVDGKWYYMHSGGYMATGWVKVSGKWYYLNSDGVMATGWKKVSGKWYYLNSDGVMATGWKTINGTKYYLNSDGAMATGWKKISSKWYYFRAGGSMVTGWLKLNNRWYYFGNDGRACTGLQTIGGKQYYFDPSGCQMLSNTTKVIDGYKYTFGASGAVTSKVNTAAQAVTTADAMDRKAQGYSSSTSYLILVNRSTHKVGIYKGKKNAWTNVKKFACGDGKSSTPTIEGTFTVGIKLRYFDSGRARCWYATQFSGNYLFHSVLYDQSSTPKTILDGRTGVGVSHGCVRLQLSNAKWIYDNIPRNTKVIVYH